MLTVSDGLQDWLSSHKARIDASQSPESNSSIGGSVFVGESVRIARLKLSGVEKLFLRNQDNHFSFCIADFGQFSGIAGDRSILMTPNRLAFVMLPDEPLKLVPKAKVVQFFVVTLDIQLLQNESTLHGNSFPNLLSLNDSIPGHEQLILACTHQLFKFANALDISTERLLQPLETSIVSLLGTLLSYVPSPSQSHSSESTSQPAYVQAALAYMEDNISENICLSDLCRVCCVSSRTLQVAFQSVMNRTPLQVLHELRLTKLRSLLLQGHEVGRACQMVGLMHSGRISANYKRLFGELPRHTRNRRSVPSSDFVAS